MSEHAAGPPDQLSATEMFEAAYLQWSPAVLGFALRRCDSREEACDIVAEAFTVAWRRREDMPDDLLGVKLWIFGIARNCLMNAHRASERSKRLVERVANHLDTSPTLDASVIHAQQAKYDFVTGALSQLADSDRYLVTLVAWEDLSPAQAGEVLGIPAGTARVRLHRARLRLRRILNDSDIDRGVINE